MTKVLFIISKRNFNYTEYSVTKQVLESNKIEVVTSSVELGVATSMEGKKVGVEKAVKDIDPEDYDALVIIGGSGSPELLKYPEVLERVREFNSSNKIVSAICLAPVILAEAGILKGVISTVFPTDWSIFSLKRSGAQYSTEKVVVDENIITADGPTSAKEFGEQINKKLKH